MKTRIKIIKYQKGETIYYPQYKKWGFWPWWKDILIKFEAFKDPSLGTDNYAIAESAIGEFLSGNSQPVIKFIDYL